MWPMLESGAGDRNRTCNLVITSDLRCQLRHAGRERKRVRWAVSISRILDGVTQPWIRTTNRSARATELVLRVFHWWGRYCLHLTFNACLRTHGPRYRIRTGPICLEGRDASRWHQSRIWRFLSQPLCKYYTTIFKKNQIFTFQNLQIGVVIWSCGAKPTLQFFVTAQ